MLEHGLAESRGAEHLIVLEDDLLVRTRPQRTCTTFPLTDLLRTLTTFPPTVHCGPLSNGTGTA